MSERVVSLFGGPTGERVVHESVVQGLEWLLEAAKSGEIVGFGVVILNYDASASHFFRGDIGGYRMAGAAACMAHEITATCIGEDG